MRIVEINDIASVASELTAGLRARGHTVDLLHLRLVGGGLPWTVKPAVSPFRAYEWGGVIRRVRQGHYDIAHIHYAYLGMLGVLGGFPYVLHCHGSDVREMTPFTRPLVEQAIRRAEHVFYATPDLERFVVPLRRDAEFLPNPIDTRTFAPVSSADRHRKVLIPCWLTEIKGAGRLLAACRRLATERPDIAITAIDSGEYAAAFARLPNVTLIPVQRREDLPGLIDQHGVIIGQVRLGAIGMAELEAMACARPLVAWFTYGRAYPEPPPLVRALDGVDIANAVIRLVDDPAARAAQGQACRAWVERHHSLDAITTRVEAVLQQAALTATTAHQTMVR